MCLFTLNILACIYFEFFHFVSNYLLSNKKPLNSVSVGRLIEYIIL